MTIIFDKFRLNDRVAIVTGGAGLLGKEFCRTLAEAGAAVVIADLDYRSASGVAETLNKSNYPSLGMALDVTNQESIHQMLANTLKTFGRLDILVNSAALDPKFYAVALAKGGDIGRFEDYPLDKWNDALNVNLTGMFLVTQACVQPMLEQGKKGSIINICSTYGLNGPDQRIYRKQGRAQTFKPVYYTVTKAGVLGFTKYLAAYYMGTELRVNALSPGGIYNNHDETFVTNYSAKTILGRMAHLDEMNGALLFLASDASSYMTGGNVIVDGGWTAW
jgi:NAD(P)-dependent dehydrogenase (short-subunit alcohol dehydrogenase family)